MEFFHVWRGLSPGQRGYLTLPMGMVWIGLTQFLREVGTAPNAGIEEFSVVLLGVAFFLALYFSVRRQARFADSQARELDIQMTHFANGRRIAQLSGNPRTLFKGVVVCVFVSVLVIFSERGVALGLALLFVSASALLWFWRSLRRLSEKTSPSETSPN